jgi:anaerobic magnesium-protoporphyrin IX monomethyl ester cyclase
MPRITFLYPDFESLGVGYLMSVCRHNGYEVDFVYYQVEDPYIYKTKKNINYEKIAIKTAATKPHIVAFSCVTDNYQYQLQCARAIKKIMPDVITIFGGIHPTSVPERVIKNHEVDCVAVGEAEISFLQFLKEGDHRDGKFILPDKSIKGMVFKKEGKLIGKYEEGDLVEDLDSIPFPYKKPFFSALKDSSLFYYISTNRGCPYTCSYCFNSYFLTLRERNILRQRSVENVIEELLWAKSQSPLKYILFLDDCFTTNSKWLAEFCDRYKKVIQLPFWCLAHPLALGRDKIEVLREAGCNSITVGVQSLSQDINKRILNRKSNNNKIARVINDLKDVGIMVQVDHILGIPDDSLQIEEESALFYGENKPNIMSVFWLTYYPKVPIIDTAKEKGILTDEDVEKIEEGEKIAEGNFHLVGSVKDPRAYFAIALILNYLPMLPKFLINFLIKSKIYRILKIKNYYISVALPRFLLSLINKKDIIGRSIILRFFDKILNRA